MLEKDVFLTVYSTSVMAPANKWAEQMFGSDALVLSMPGQGGNDFRANIINWGRTGDVFGAAVKRLAPKEDIKIRRRILVTFSAGWAAGDELLKLETEVGRLDAYILLDGCHTENLTHWQRYANKAACGEAAMWMAHSSIKPPFVSTTVTNGKLFEGAQKVRNNATNALKYDLEIPEILTDTQLSSPISITAGAVGNVKAVTKVWTTDPLLRARSCGNLLELHYGGDDRPDHMYIAWHTQKKLWQALSELYR